VERDHGNEGGPVNARARGSRAAHADLLARRDNVDNDGG
jgi:hypothetical protein